MINVGEYIRDFHGIGKVVEAGESYCRKENGLKVWLYKQNKIKHSKNIIDLIEVGDYVNGERVTFITNSKIKEKKIITEYDTDFFEKYEKIETIVTKEQFKEMEYRV